MLWYLPLLTNRPFYLLQTWTETRHFTGQPTRDFLVSCRFTSLQRNFLFNFYIILHIRNTNFRCWSTPGSIPRSLTTLGRPHSIWPASPATWPQSSFSALRSTLCFAQKCDNGFFYKLLWSRDQWFWQNFIISMSCINFWKAMKIENLFTKNRFSKFSKCTVHMTLVKSAPKKSFSQKNYFTNWKSHKKIGFWAKLFLGALYTKVICTFLKSVWLWKDGFFDTPFDLIKEKKFSSHGMVSVYFLSTKKSKMEATTQYFWKRFIINRS